MGQNSRPGESDPYEVHFQKREAHFVLRKHFTFLEPCAVLNERGGNNGVMPFPPESEDQSCDPLLETRLQCEAFDKNSSAVNYNGFCSMQSAMLRNILMMVFTGA